MLKVTVKEIFTALPVLNIIAQFAEMGNLPFPTVQKIKAFADNATIITDANNERQKILDKFCKEVKEKTDIKSVDKYYEVVNKENYAKYILQLDNYLVDLVNFTPFTNEDLKDIKGVNQGTVELLGKFLENNSNEQRQEVKLNFEDENENI